MGSGGSTAAVGRDSLARRLPLLALLGANVVSVVGGSMSLVALPWFVLASTGSAALTGLAGACETLPVVASSVVAGTVVERLGARRTRVVSDTGSCVAVLGVPVLHAWVGLAYWELLILVAVNGALRTPAVAASLVLFASVSRPGQSGQPAQTGAYAASVSIATTAGAPLAGAMIVLSGAPAVLVVDAATFAVSALLIHLFVPDRQSPATRRAEAATTGLRAGLRVLRQDHTLALLTGIAVAVMVLEAGWAGVLAPLYGQRILHSATQLGLLLGAFGFGAVLANLGYPCIATRLPLHRLLWLALLVEGTLRFTALAAQLALPVLIGVLLCAGAAAGLLNPFALDRKYERVGPQLHSHLFGLTYGLSQAGVAAGALLTGALASVATVLVALAWFAGLALLVAAAAGAPPLRNPRQTTSRADT